MSDNLLPPGDAGAVYEHSFFLAASPDAVFRALLDEAGLRVWFAEHVEVEPRAGGRYRFWGRHTPFAREDAEQRITALEPGTRLAFRWRWGSGNTHVDLRLRARASGTEVTVHHDLRGGGAGRTPRESCWLAHDFWRVALGNLEHFLARGTPALLPDYSDPREDVELALEVEAPLEEVWRSLTEPEELRQWMEAVDPVVELREGGRYSYGWIVDGHPCGPVEILELVPPRRLVLRWEHQGDATDRTEWELAPLGPERTRVVVRQCRTTGAREFFGYTGGWAAYLLELKRHGERRGKSSREHAFDLEEARALLARTPALLAAWLRDLPAAWLSCDEGPETWSPESVVAHLIEGERSDWIPRVHHLLEVGEAQAFPPFQRFAHLAAPPSPLGARLEEFAVLRARNLAALEGLKLTDAHLDRRGRHPEFGSVTLRQHLATWVAHDLSHVTQIARVMAHRYAEAVGPWKAYLRVVREAPA